MVSIYTFDDSLVFLRSYVDSLPKGQKRGEYNRMAQAAGVFPSYLSQIFKGDRALNSDQALGIAEHLQLNSQETRYFLRLCDLSRAQTAKLKARITEELNELKSLHYQISNQVSYDNVSLSEEDRQKFFSSWIYSAVKLLLAIPECRTVSQISERLRQPQDRIKNILNFLVKTGLAKQDGDLFIGGPTHIHLDNNSPLIANHHSNWRKRAMDKHPFLSTSHELAYSGCFALSKSDVIQIRTMLIEQIKELRKVSDPSPSQVLYALNMDWIEV